MSWLWLGTIVLSSLPVFALLFLVFLHLFVRWKYLDFVLRIFPEKPPFIIPRGEQRDGDEDVRFRTRDGLLLRGCYLRTERAERKGVILYGVEFGSSRWSCRSYCEALLQSGYDVFAFEPRNQGDSEGIEAYEPLQWLTDHEVTDIEAAIAYLKQRPDADPNGIGFFGVSKGANAGLLAASRDPWVRCIITDGAFATYGTMVPYMRRWLAIYSERFWIQSMLPHWFYGNVAMIAVRHIGAERGVHYVHIEGAVSRLKKPLLMIHGGDDSYIWPEMANKLYRRARGPKELWVVKRAKHNQALQVAGEEYHRKIVAFFDRYLAPPELAPVSVDTAPDDPSLSSKAEIEAV
jgi:uncharacterized protein